MAIFPFHGYHVKLRCDNCGYENDLLIHNGVTVKTFLESNASRCKECGCKINQSEYETDWKKGNISGNNETKTKVTSGKIDGRRWSPR